MDWYKVKNEHDLDSPALLVYRNRVEKNVALMLEIVDNDPSRLMPHIKTNKMENVIKMMMAKGIQRFKCATIAEAELAAKVGAKEVLIAHQLVGAKLLRLKKLIVEYKQSSFGTLVDNLDTLAEIETVFTEQHPLPIYIDVNNGMNRTGVEVENLETLHYNLVKSKKCRLRGWHVYDGHIREEGFVERKNAVEKGMVSIEKLVEKLNTTNQFELIAGGSPAFTSHATETNRLCSPGTSVFWDWGYGDKFKEKPFLHAAVVLTRIISKPTKGIITIDLGHKAIASENAIDKRVRFLNLSDYELLSQSEEHGVLKVGNWDELKVGTILYGVPYHICPTVNLFDEAYLIENNLQTEVWKIEGRKRKITY